MFLYWYLAFMQNRYDSQILTIRSKNFLTDIQVQVNIINDDYVSRKIYKLQPSSLVVTRPIV